MSAKSSARHAQSTLAQRSIELKWLLLLLPGRGLSDALDRVTSHLREARDLIHTARPSRHEQHAGATPPDLAGGITFALDLSQAFDTVSRQSIIDNLSELGDPSDVVRLVHALHNGSQYRLQTQQGCKLAPTLFSFLTGCLFQALADTFGVQAVVHFLTGYADDLAIHRTIRKVADLKAIHGLIAGLLAEVRRHSLVVNKSKCVILVKLVGREAAPIIKKHSCWVLDSKGNKVKGWRLGPNKSYPAFQWASQAKYLGVIISYGHFEQQTLQRRIQEAKQKLHLVRKFVYNRRVASTKSRMKVWNSTVLSTLLTGLADTGLTQESARTLRSWHAHKVRSVLNQPAHISRVSTSDLFALHGIKDPVRQVRTRMQKRLKKLTIKTNRAPDITTAAPVLQCLRDKIAAIDLLPVPAKDPAQAYVCASCSAVYVFETAHGLHMHVTKQHPTSVRRFIPSTFDRLRHAVDGLPKCAACDTSFKQWKGLRDHLLSGACPAPDKLQSLTNADAQGTAPETRQLAVIRTELLALPRHQLCSYASRPPMTLLNHRCLVCNFWTPDRTKVKSHFRQAHPGDWARLHQATVKLCQTFTTHTIKGQVCPFCSFKVHDRRNHPEQCPVLYQAISQWTSGSRQDAVFLNRRRSLYTAISGRSLQQGRLLSPPPRRNSRLVQIQGLSAQRLVYLARCPTQAMPVTPTRSCRQCRCYAGRAMTWESLVL